MRIRLTVPVKVPKKDFRVNKKFKSRSKITQRTMAIAEAFGIGIDAEHEFIVFKDFHVDINPGDVVYIVGDSGGGKSVLLKELARKMALSPEFSGVIRSDELSIDPDEVIIEGVGTDVNGAISKLSKAGLNEAFLFLRRYRELSDGQRYRYRIAKMLDSNAGAWCLDEFASTLDRETAKIVAFCLQKIARKAGKTVVVATTHDDLFDDLRPSVIIRKGFGHDVRVSHFPNEANERCSLAKLAKIREDNKKDYDRLKHYHYRGGYPFGVKKVFAMELMGEVIGIIVYSLSPLSCAPRNHHLGRVVKSDELNRDFLRIARVILHPKYRSIGLGARLVRETLLRSGATYVEAIAVMARYNPFFERAGMKKVKVESGGGDGLRKVIQSLKGFRPEFISSVAYNEQVLKGLSREDYEEAKRRVMKASLTLLTLYSGKKPSRERIREDLEDVTFMAKAIRDIAIKAQRKEYYIWKRD